MWVVFALVVGFYIGFCFAALLHANDYRDEEWGE